MAQQRATASGLIGYSPTMVRGAWLRNMSEGSNKRYIIILAPVTTGAASNFWEIAAHYGRATASTLNRVVHSTHESLDAAIQDFTILMNSKLARGYAHEHPMFMDERAVAPVTPDSFERLSRSLLVHVPLEPINASKMAELVGDGNYLFMPEISHDRVVLQVQDNKLGMFADGEVVKCPKEIAKAVAGHNFAMDGFVMNGQFFALEVFSFNGKKERNLLRRFSGFFDKSYGLPKAVTLLPVSASPDAKKHALRLAMETERGLIARRLDGTKNYICMQGGMT